GSVGASRDPVGHPVERVALDDGGGLGVEAVGGGGIGIPVVLQPHAFVGEPAEGPPAGDGVLPQLGGGDCVGVPAGHADDRDPRHAFATSSWAAGLSASSAAALTLASSIL